MSAVGPQSAARHAAWSGKQYREPPPTPDALQALLADPKLLKLLRTAIGDPGRFERRGGSQSEPMVAWQARAVRTALRQVSDAPRPEGHIL